MAKVTSTNKKTAAKKTNTKAAAKKATPAKKTATPVKKAATAKKAVPAKKAAPAKKVVATTKKAAAPAKKAATAKKSASTVKKAAMVKKAAPIKKTTTTKKATAPTKKATVVKKTAAASKTASTAKKTAPKKAVTPKKAATTKAAASKTVTSNKKAASPTTTTKKPMNNSNTKSTGKKAAAPKDIAPPKVDIVDAVTKKSDLKKSKPGQIAIRDLDRKSSAKKTNAEENIDTFNPTKTSILANVDSPNHGYRYSDEDLNEFKEIILKRLDVARENLNYYQALMARKDESGTDDTDNRFNSMEDGSGVMEREQLSQLAARQMQFIDHLEKALMRIENKTYGVCRVTGKLIDKARLKAVPHATLSIEAKQNRR